MCPAIVHPFLSDYVRGSLQKGTGQFPPAARPELESATEATMAALLDREQRDLAVEIAALLSTRGETVAVAESTSGGLVSAALLSVAGASRYYAGGGVLYTPKSRTELAGVPAEQYEHYRGTTPDMLNSLAESMLERLGATWCVAESGLAGPSGGRNAPAGRTLVSVAGPRTANEALETGSAEREANMAAFTTFALRTLRDAILAVS
jgi:nicotinamide-nucleotide amidase